MEKKNIFILIVVILIVLGAAGYFYWQNYLSPATKESAVLENVGDAAQTITDSASKGVLPSMNVQTNPLEKAPDTNPINKTNPFSNIKTNPFK